MIVLGYGCNLDGYKIRDYLDFVAEIQKKLGNGYLLLPSGGFTNPRQFPGVSEAGMMKDRLLEISKSKIPFLDIEEFSVTTNQNIENCAQILKRYEVSEVIIICDSIRVPKVKIIAKRYLNNYKIQILGFDFGRSLKEKLRQIPATIKDVLSLWFPKIEEYFVKKRKKEWGIVEGGEKNEKS